MTLYPLTPEDYAAVQDRFNDFGRTDANIILTSGHADERVFPSVVHNLNVQAIPFRHFDCPGREDYTNLVRDLYEEGEPFILVEQDILPWPGALFELWDCDCAWGGFSYLWNGVLAHWLGCTKFVPNELPSLEGPWMGAQPDRLDFDGGPDAFILHALRAEGLEYHLHGPPVVNLHTGHRRHMMA